MVGTLKKEKGIIFLYSSKLCSILTTVIPSDGDKLPELPWERIADMSTKL